jgi:hypothetical protein
MKSFPKQYGEKKSEDVARVNDKENTMILQQFLS